MDNRALLDELMGKDRNELPSRRQNKGVHFSDPEICKNYICGFCPSDLFTNTKSDLGPCTYVHDEYCKQEWQDCQEKEKYPYHKEFIQYLEKVIDDLDRKIRKGKERLDLAEDVPMSKETEEKLSTISLRIQMLLKQIEDLGEEGKVEESQQLMKLVDQLKADKEVILLTGDHNQAMRSSALSQEKRMKVCEVCGAFLVVGDTQQRISSHLDGKQHIGYALIRNTIEEYRKEHPREKEREKPAPKERDRRDSRDGRDNRDSRDHRDRDRDYHRDRRDRDRDFRDRERDRKRDRDYDRDRERDRDRDYDRDRKKFRDKDRDH